MAPREDTEDNQKLTLYCKHFRHLFS